ncbi:MAG: phosphotransferase [Gammaproteobacteria bacterium]
MVRTYDLLAARLAEEARDRPVPSTAADIPLNYDVITPRWLSAILCANHPGAEVIHHRLSAPDEGTSSRRRIILEYNETGQRAGLPTSVFCKSTHTLTSRLRLALVGFITAEVNFYRHMRHLFNIEAPRCLFANVNEHTFNSIIVLHDLTGSAKFCRHDEPMTRARAASQLRLLAKLHARYYASPALATQFPFLRTWDELFTFTAEAGYRRICLRGFRMAEAVIPPRLFAREEEIWPATMASVQRHAELPQTIIHSDVHLKNWYLAANGEMGLNDWQCVCRGHWSRDLAYCISTALTIDDRRKWEGDLIAYYLECLSAAGGPAIPVDFAWQHYREQLFGALAWWTGTLGQPPDKPGMQPRDSSLEFIARIATALDDHEALDGR